MPRPVWCVRVSAIAETASCCNVILERETLMNRPGQKIPGYNVDPLNVSAGLRELKTCGYDEPKTVMVIEYALRRWARGEEAAAQQGAIDQSFHGISLTCWLRVLAAAMAAADKTAPVRA